MKIDWSLIDDGRIARSRDVQIKTIYSELEQADFVGSDNSVHTATTVAAEFVGIIPGSSTVKSGYRFPIACPKSAASDYRDMILTVYEYRQEAAIGEKFGCCNDFRRCSDARECLHKNDDDYRGCYYRKNLEAGRIFYGINKNC